MVFSSIAFLFYFLPVFFVLYWLLPWRNQLLLTASLLFYFWGETSYTLIMIASITMNWWFGRMIGRREATAFRWLAFGISGNLALLIYFKYVGFLAVEVLNLTVPENSLPHLPLGISFFTFQAMSYLIDVYRRDAQAAGSWIDVGAYISMFPQLIAGPIVRYQEVADALVSRTVNSENVRRGFLVFNIGLIQKLVFANPMGEVADAIFAQAQNGGAGWEAWLGITAYSLQIYFDFAGYSNMALGIGQLLGFKFPENFNLPYSSQCITEFWRRWHMTLSRWFRDYLYIPLGGNRKGKARTYLNLIIVFLLCGTWHGASWVFVLWGCYHGCFLVLERIGLGVIIAKQPRLLRHAYTLIVVMAGWVLFRSDNLEMAGRYFSMFLGNLPNDALPRSIWNYLDHEKLLIFIMAIAFSFPLGQRMQKQMKTKFRGNWTEWIGATALYFIAVIYLANSTYNPFIYFRF